MTNAFSNLKLSAPYLETLNQIGFVEMTPIQAEALPHLLDGKDIIGHAQTGTGKTAAFALSLLNRLNERGGKNPQALVLCPTRELAAQITDEIRRLGRHLSNMKVLSICGGTPVRRQRESLRFGVDVVVGTPGRVLDLIKRETLKLSSVSTLVLDEADRMLDMGFLEDVEEIAGKTPADRQTLLFSATMSRDVQNLADTFQNQPITISVVDDVDEGPNIVSNNYSVNGVGRNETLIRALALHEPESAVVFCNMRVTCDEVGALLKTEGHSVLVLHGGMDQRDRNRTLMLFDNRSVRVLVATDVAARGLDVEDIAAVVNYDLPKQVAIFTHRIGRTGRAGRTGMSISLVDAKRTNDKRLLSKGLGEFEILDGSTLPEKSAPPLSAQMKTIEIAGGKKVKLRAGDIVGAFTNDFGLKKDDVGKITILEYATFVAVTQDLAKDVVKSIQKGRIKNRKFKARLLRS